MDCLTLDPPLRNACVGGGGRGVEGICTSGQDLNFFGLRLHCFGTEYSSLSPHFLFISLMTQGPQGDHRLTRASLGKKGANTMRSDRTNCPTV